MGVGVHPTLMAWQADAVLGTRDEDPEPGLPALRWVRKDALDVRALSSSVKKVYALAEAAGASAAKQGEPVAE